MRRISKECGDRKNRDGKSRCDVETDKSDDRVRILPPYDSNFLIGIAVDESQTGVQTGGKRGPEKTSHVCLRKSQVNYIGHNLNQLIVLSLFFDPNF